MARFELDSKEFDRLQRALQNYQGDTEKEINDVLHNEASPLIQEAIQRLIPTSGKTWKGKRPPAKTGNSLTDQKGNLSITVKSTTKYNYLYFPDDGTNTRRHAGNQQFFKRGGESKQTEIVDRCVNRLVDNFEKTV